MGALVELVKQCFTPNGKRFAVLEVNRACNRNCPSCAVPGGYDRASEQTVAQTFESVEWLHEQGFRLLSYLGGEPLAGFRTKENITFFQHTQAVVRHAARQGMIVSVTTNGDFATDEKIKLLKQAGVFAMTFSLHKFTERGVGYLIDRARFAAEVGIVPTVQAVMTTETVGKIPYIATLSARNGLLFSVGLVQEKSGGFSTRPEDSTIPSLGQQRDAFATLLRLKKFGFVRNNTNYLRDAPMFYPNNWSCDPDQDTFIHIGAGGTVDVCSDVRTNLNIEDVGSLDSLLWRRTKRELVQNCGNCLFHCYFEAQQPDLLGDIPMVAINILNKIGKFALVRRFGEKVSQI